MKNKILIFIAGLFAGITIGVLFSVAIKELITQFKEVHISLNKINLKQNQLAQRLDSIQGKLIPDVKKPSQSISKTTNSYSSGKTTIPGKPKPTKNIDTSSNASMDDDSNVVVMTNQLISVLSVPLKNMDISSVNKKIQQTDSTLASMSDIKNTKDPLQYRIELWKSPLNYKGYKMSQGKIILYGIDSGAPINLTLEEGSYYLLINQKAYKLGFTDDYKPFEKISDKETLKTLGL